MSTGTPIIIHADGGVGKTVVGRQLADSLPFGSFGIVYDCFGGGTYRNASEPRHRASDGLIQIANELATRGYCRTLLGPNKSMDAIFRAFLERVEQAAQSLRELKDDALLVILIDAADNAEMAAADVGEKSFVRFLLREPMPEACRVVMLCRTERIDLLDPPSSVTRYPLVPFSENESTIHLRQSWPDATDQDGVEFHRLTGGNPRVQATALALAHSDINELLASLGPLGTTVDDQINAQLAGAIAQLKDRSPQLARAQIDAICSGLANFPPFIPLEVLARASGVHDAAVRSFVSDLGRPLWLTDNAVQFRDEPTETWFRNSFSGTAQQISAHAQAVESLAARFPYVARSLPQLLLRAGEFERLIELALSDQHLPQDSPIDERDVRVYRLQFAFRAALKLKRYADAARLALRAAEEVAGDHRQTALLQDNIDLIAPLQDSHRVQELAYRQTFQGGWEGSTNAYAAALLSSVADFKGEARAYLRAARRWLEVYFEQRKKTQRKHGLYPEELTDNDLLEFAWARLNLFGPADCTKFLVGWRPPELVFKISRLLARRLVDAARYEVIDEIGSRGSKNIYLIIALTEELRAVARCPAKRTLLPTLARLANPKKQIPINNDTLDRPPLVPAIVSFAEACASHGLSAKKIDAVLSHYVAEHAHPSLVRDYGASPELFLRAAALRRVLDNKFVADVDSLLPKKTSDKNSPDYARAGEDVDLRQTLEGLFPWYVARARLLCGHSETVSHAVLVTLSERAVSGRYKRFDRLPQQVSLARFELLSNDPSPKPDDLDAFITQVVRTSLDVFHLGQRLSAFRTVARHSRLDALRSELEASIRRSVEVITNETPEQRGQYWIDLARAVLPISPSDARAYFNLAVEAVSKFGDEVVERWQAIIGLAKRTSFGGYVQPDIAYRFFRVAEVAGDPVSREKYWDRDEVFAVGAQIAPESAFAALSRWRDRHVGFLSRQLESLITKTVSIGALRADVGWSFSGFYGCYGSSEFAVTCISHADDPKLKQAILDVAVPDLRLSGANQKDLPSLKQCAETHNLDVAALDALIRDLEGATAISDEQSRHPYSPYSTLPSTISSAKLLDGLGFTTAGGITEAIRRFDEFDERREFPEFWREIVRRIPKGDEAKFLDALIAAETVDVYDIIYAVQAVTENWSERIVVKRGWRSFAKKLGRRFPVQFSNSDRLYQWFPVSEWDKQSLTSLRDGAIEGLAESLELLSASTLFGFVTSLVSSLTAQEAGEVLEFGISRFEVHIAQDYGDGGWAEWLTPPANLSDAVAGFIWSALGSPDSAERWQAVHCVRRLVELSCSDEIAALLRRVQTSGVGAFGSQRFPFYQLHAVFYLLIGFWRAAIDAPHPLLPHSNAFSQRALFGMPHVLIQRAAAAIALLLEKAAPGTYDADLAGRLGKVGYSPFPLRLVSDSDTTFPAQGLVTRSQSLPNFYLGWDFDDYWFKDLARLFAVDNNELLDAAKNIAIGELGVPENADQPRDGRRDLWQSASYGHWATSHDHGSYPKVDDYAFYYSYHAFFSVAARLLNSNPVVRRTGGYWEDREDPWGEWLRDHWIRRADGRWIADRRDPTPLIRRDWLKGKDRKDWLWSVKSEDFFDCISRQTSLPNSLCVAGSWVDNDWYYAETIRVRSALVNRETSTALANAIRTREHSYSGRLPSYKEVDAEFAKPPFDLLGWIVEPNGTETRLDSFDPHAREMGYPPLSIGEAFASLLALEIDEEKRQWQPRDGGKTVVKSETWSEEKPWRRGGREEPFRHGLRLCAAIPLLKELCGVTDKDLVILVEISRNEERTHSAHEYNPSYLEPSHKVFVLCADGNLKDAARNYQLG